MGLPSKMDRPSTIDESIQILNLMQFLEANKWQNDGLLRVADFPETGRGIRTIGDEAFYPSDTLIDMPFKSVFISLITIMEDKGFRNHCLSKLEANVSTQLLLTVYVLYQQHLGDKSGWQAYIDTLPLSLSTPHFCKQEELDCVPMVRHLVTNAVQDIINSFQSAFDRSLCQCCGGKLVDIISKDQLLLMYFLVNSRSVYCDPVIIRNNCPGRLPLSDEPNMALAPFLDFFNHSDSVETESNLFLDKRRSELRYELITNTAMASSGQLFISYGNHCNFKLLMEYGFVIEGNQHEKIDLSMDQIENFMKSYPKFYHAKKVVFIKSQKMHSEVFISSEGMSYNLETIFKIFKSAGLTEKSLSELVYKNSTTVPIDDSVDLEKDLYSYLIGRFSLAEGALNKIEQLTESGKMLKEFFSGRIRFLRKLVTDIEERE